MLGKVRLVIAAVAAVAVGAGGVPVAAQQPGGLLPGTRALYSSIQGRAVNWNNSGMANTPVRLRDARLGRVLDSVRTDRVGAFEFHNLEPGSYVAEMMNSTNDAVLAATPIVNVDSGQSVSVLIKLSTRTATPAAVFGISAVAVAVAAVAATASTALAITSAGNAAGVPATTVAGAPATDRALPGQR
jgi:hypothetical protein